MSKELEALINKTSEHLYLYKELKNEPFYKRCQELFQELITIKQSLQPNKEQLRDEIISELNEYETYKVLGYKSHYCEKDRHFYVMSDKDKACGFGIVDGKLFLSHLIPLQLASKIIKYFELESE